MRKNENEKPRRRLVGVNDGIEYVGVGRTQLYKLIAQGKIVAVRLGGRTMIDLDSADKFHRELPQLPAKAG